MLKREIVEDDVVAALKKRVKELGGMIEKFTSPARRSVPDELITLPGGRIIFVECKRPGKEPTVKQAKDHKRRRDLGCDVRVISTIEAARAFPDEA